MHNMKVLVFAVIAGISAYIGACASQPKYTQAQLNSIETREVDASFDETYSAAANAIFDAGYTIAMSDRASGLITGEAGKDNSSARIWVSPAIADSQFRISMQIRAIDGRRTSVRIKTSTNGEPVVDKKAIDKIWTLMQRQVLMKEPAAIELQQSR